MRYESETRSRLAILPYEPREYYRIESARHTGYYEHHWKYSVKLQKLAYEIHDTRDNDKTQRGKNISLFVKQKLAQLGLSLGYKFDEELLDTKK